MLVTITSEEKILVSLNPVTAAGNPAQVDGTPAWSVVSGDATIEPSTDGLSCYLISGAVGNSQITVTADADLGEGVREITDTVDLAVVSAEASQLGLSVGTAEPK
jgi:hypothetical protein